MIKKLFGVFQKKKSQYILVHFFERMRYFFYEKFEHKKVSVVIACHNSSEFILKSLYSLLNQTHNNIEVIIVDDASTDDTVKKIIDFQKDNNLNIILHRSLGKIGVAQARNIGLSLATGDYVTFQDSDDLSHKCRIEFQLKSLLNNKNKKISFCLYNRFYNNKIIKINKKKYSKCIISIMFLREEILLTFGGMIPINIGEDSEFRERILAYYGNSVEIILQMPLYYAHFSPDSTFFSACVDLKYKDNKVLYDTNKIYENDKLYFYRVWHQKIKQGLSYPHMINAPEYIRPVAKMNIEV